MRDDLADCYAAGRYRRGGTARAWFGRIPGLGSPGWAKPRRARLGRLGAELALAIVGVAVAAVISSFTIAALTANAAHKQMLMRQEVMQTQAAAAGAAATYVRSGWRPALSPVIAIINRDEAAAQVRDAKGQVVRASSWFTSSPRHPEYRAPVIAGGRRVGSITVKYGGRGLSAILARLSEQRWRARLIGGSIGALMAIAVAAVVALRIIAPLNRLVDTVRARAAGQPDARVSNIHGFRDLRELGASLDRMADALGRQDQLRRNLVADIAHQLRTPVSVLRAGSEAMLDGVAGLTFRNVESLHEESIQLGRMVDDLQRLSAAESAAVQLALSPCQLDATVAACADALTDIFDHAGVHLSRQLDPVTACCDQRRIHDIITNLLTNAAKYTPRGGAVTLETRNAGPNAIMRVSDTGIGIPPDDLPQITGRFYRGTNSAQVPGSGIGLAIVDELVRGHHGTMDVVSEEGQGTQVTITIPRT